MVFIPWFEGFGIPLLEAFAAGTPAIHSNWTSLPEVADGAGLEVDPGMSNGGCGHAADGARAGLAAEAD